MADFGLSTNEIIPLFNLKEDQISEVVKTAKGPYFFQLKSKIVDFSPKFEEVKEKVKERLTYEKAKELAKTRMDDYLVKIKEKKETSPDLGLAEIAQSLDLSTAETDFFDSHSQPQEIGNSPEFNEVIFGLGEGEISKVIEFDRGYCIAQVSERKPIDEEAFVKEKDEVQKVALREKKDKIFEDYFNKLKEQSGLIDYVSTQQPTGQEQPADKSNPNVKPVDKSDLDVTQVDEF
jgi:predicted RNA-binding protein